MTYAIIYTWQVCSALGKTEARRAARQQTGLLIKLDTAQKVLGEGG